ncbi:MAG: transglycosylase domain-containing protein [Erythrobacter sp.]
MLSWFRSSSRAKSSHDSRRQAPTGDSRDAGYYAVEDPYGSAFDAFDERFETGPRDKPKRKWWGGRKRHAPIAAYEEEPRPRGRKRKWFVRAVAAILFLIILAVGWLAFTAPLSKSLEPIAPPQITLLASDGTPIARSGAVVDQPVEIGKLPDHVIEAFLAIEDRRFYSHWGVDPRGLARAALSNATGGPTQGGSTITQQLAKFTFLTPERSLTRKAREMLIAFWLEGWLTKDEILQRYLSNAYFGDNQYGLRAASLHYFYRQPENLRPEQAAMLAGLLKAPSRLAPTRNYDLAQNRMRIVIGAMADAGYITEQEASDMRSPKLDVRNRNTLPTGTYFADWVLPTARNDNGRSYTKQTLTTTLDARLQSIASQAVARAPLGDAQVALVAMRPSGEVVAMIGGKDYARSPFNRATQAKRQPGSTFKLFTYLAAIEAGMSPTDRIDNSPIETGSYRPRNYDDRYSDSITLEEAFATSSNVATVRLFNQLGSEKVIATARDLGIASDLPAGDPSLALGTSTLSLLELTSAYAGIAANIYPVDAHAFPKEEKGGWFNWAVSGEDALSGVEHDRIERLLRSAINDGTGKAAMLAGANFGKTGTTQDYRDALFVGYAGDLVVGVWIGNDDNSPLNKVTGGGLPARIWRDFMRGALSGTNIVVPMERPDPDGPIQPFDISDIGDIPLDDNGSNLSIEEDGLIVTTEIDGVPVRFELTEDGLQVTSDP